MVMVSAMHNDFSEKDMATTTEKNDNNIAIRR